MAKRRRSNSTRYKSDTGYSPSNNLVEKLKRSVKNYNARIKYQSKKLGEFSDILPPQASFEGVIKRATRAADINKAIRQMERLKGSGFNLVATPAGEAITQGELENLKENIREENRYRRKRAKIKKEIEEFEGRFATQADEELKPVEIKETDTVEKLRRKNEYYSDYYRALQAIRWRDTYIAKVEQARDTAILTGAGEDIIQLLYSLIDLIRNVDNAHLITYAAYSPSVDIKITSDILLFISSVEEVYEDWKALVEDFG